MSVAHSILLYGAEIWEDALNVSKYRRRIASVQRRCALRVICAYRTVSEAAFLMIAGAIPIYLMVKESKAISERKIKESKERWNSIENKERSQTLHEWQELRYKRVTGRWTVRLIGVVQMLTNRKHEETNFYLTQLFTSTATSTPICTEWVF